MQDIADFDCQMTIHTLYCVMDQVHTHHRASLSRI